MEEIIKMCLLAVQMLNVAIDSKDSFLRRLKGDGDGSHVWPETQDEFERKHTIAKSFRFR